MQSHKLKRHISLDIQTTIPEVLRSLQCWITWIAGATDQSGKFEKLPKGRNGTGIGWQRNSEQLMGFNEALQTVEARGHSGIGLVLPVQMDGLYLVAFDFDGVDLQAPNSPRVLEIQEIHKQLGEPYIEASPSGKGLRIFVFSEEAVSQISVRNPNGGKDELFCESPRWVTVTGHTLGGSGAPNATAQVQKLVSTWKERAGAAKSARTTPLIDPSSKPGWNGWPIEKIRDGDGREAKMLSYAGHLRIQGYSQKEIERLCLEANNEHYEDPLDESTVLDRARRFEIASPHENLGIKDDVLDIVDQTDAGNVARLWELTNGDIRFVYEIDTWIYWTGQRWEYDSERSNLYRQTLRVAATYSRKAKRIEKEIDDPGITNEQKSSLKKVLKSLEKWIVQCRNRSRLDAMTTLAEKDPRFTISTSRLDRDPCLLGVANGVVCLRSGILRAVSKDDFILRRSTVNFNSHAKMDVIQNFINEITAVPDGMENGKIKPASRLSLASYVQKLSGYCATGLTREHVMFMFCGIGANGKSLLADLLREILGTYAEVVQPELLLSAKSASSAEQASPSTRKLAGSRVATTSESKEGAQLDVAVVKRHTGDSKMTARGLFERPVTFEITHKLIFLTNQPPRVDHMDEAIKARLHVVPFDMRWNRPGTTEYDPSLPDADKELFPKLMAEAEGWLRFIVEGAVAYFKEGLTPPSEVTSFTRGYISAQDTVRRWITEECAACPPSEGLLAIELYASYKAFCISESELEQASSAAAIGKRLKQIGYASQKTRNGARYGLKLREIPLSSSPIHLVVNSPNLAAAVTV